MQSSLNYGDNLKRNTSGAAPHNITAQMRGWRDSVSAMGGYWQASGQYWQGKDDTLVSKLDAEQFFLNNLGAHIVRYAGGRVAWEGRIAAMELTEHGITTRRSLSEMANKVKVIYSRWDSNRVVNGDAEGTTLSFTSWEGNAAAGPVVSRSTAWSYGGTYSWRIDNLNNLFEPGNYGGAQVSCGSITGGRTYRASGVVYVPSGTAGEQVDLDIWEEGYQVEHWNICPDGAGGTFSFVYEYTSDPKDTSIDPCIATFSANQILDASWGFHIDNFSFKEASTPTETDWVENTDSQAMYGVCERVVLGGGMLDAEAGNRGTGVLYKYAWPRNRFIGMSDSDGLRVEAEGYVFTLGDDSLVSGLGDDAASDHITNLLSGAGFVTAGYIETNASEVYLDEDYPLRRWDGIETVAKAGGASGARYIAGVYGGRKLRYEARPSTVSYIFKGGRWLNPDYTPADQRTMLPGIVLFDDMPSGPGTPVGGTTEDNPRYCYVSKWEYDMDSNTATPQDIQEWENWQG